MIARQVKKPKLIAIVGQTATGKSGLAVRLARKFGGEVVSADSRQVYKGLDIGTGKVTRKEMRDVPHRMLDVADPRKLYSVAEYQRASLDHIRYIVARGKLPILCGGTGFYMQSVIDGIVLPEVKPDAALRKKLSRKSPSELFRMLRKLDPKRAEAIDRHNPRRLLRAIEIAAALGAVPKVTKAGEKYDVLIIGLALMPEALKAKIRKRLKARLAHGMVAEAKRLHGKGLSWKRMEELGLEYRHLAKYLRGQVTKGQMIKELETAIWHYAKRQMTWFKRDTRIKWFHPDEAKKIEKEVKNFLK